MYSGIVKRLMDDNDLKIGDYVRFKSNKFEIEGKIIQNSEFTKENIIILKYENGYNLGLDVTGLMVEKIKRADEAETESEAKAEISINKDLPKISIIYTGGTIGSKVDYRTGGVYMLLKPEELLSSVPELSNIADIKPRQLFSVASEDMTFHEWRAIAKAITEEINNGSRGIVITIGTDTMHYISAALSFMVQNLNVPVVLTGSQRSSDRGSSDAFMNLICSAQIAAKSDVKEVGICMHKSSSDDACIFIRGTKARKMNTSRRDAFRPINDLPIAEVKMDGEINYTNDYINKPSGKLELKDGFEEKVALIKVFPNSDPDIINYYVKKGYKGIIIEGTGLGHTPVSGDPEKSYLKNIKSAVDSGVIIGMTSQCIYGRVNSKVYTNLRLLSEAGVIYCEDMTPETAYVKLAWLLGNYSSEDAKRLLNQNMVGEIRNRTLYDEFLI